MESSSDMSPHSINKQVSRANNRSFISDATTPELPPLVPPCETAPTSKRRRELPHFLTRTSNNKVACSSNSDFSATRIQSWDPDCNFCRLNSCTLDHFPQEEEKAVDQKIRQQAFHEEQSTHVRHPDCFYCSTGSCTLDHEVDLNDDEKLVSRAAPDELQTITTPEKINKKPTSSGDEIKKIPKNREVNPNCFYCQINRCVLDHTLDDSQTAAVSGSERKSVTKQRKKKSRLSSDKSIVSVSCPTGVEINGRMLRKRKPVAYVDTTEQEEPDEITIPNWTNFKRGEPQQLRPKSINTQQKKRVAPLGFNMQQWLSNSGSLPAPKQRQRFDISDL